VSLQQKQVKREPAPSAPYSLHLSSWNTRKKAQKMVRAHKQAGLKAYLTKIDLGNKGIWWRVSSGRYETEEEALKVKIDHGFSDAIIRKTAYPALVGTYASKDEMQAAIRKLREPAPSVPYSLHLSSWNTRKKARKMVRVHKQAGLKAYLTKIDLGNKGIWWRVFSGCYETEEEALKVKIDRGFSDAIIIKTAYAALVGTYASKDEMQANIRKLEALGFDPYPVMGKDGIFWLYSGAYYLQIGADTHEFELTVKGIEAATALR
jgi:cell division septation protein DedD